MKYKLKCSPFQKGHHQMLKLFSPILIRFHTKTHFLHQAESKSVSASLQEITHTRTHTHTYTINYATISTTSTQSNTDLDPLCDNYVPLKKKEISCKSSYDAHTLDEEMVIDFHCA